MKIPEKFIINHHEITVKYEEDLVDKFGYYDPVDLSIHLGKSVISDSGKSINLTEVQINNTYLHELIHVFQHMSGMEYDEVQAQTFANFLYDYFLNNE